MTRLLICTSHDLVLFSGVSVVKDGSKDDEAVPVSTRRAILPSTLVEAHLAPLMESTKKTEPAPALIDDGEEVSDTAPTLVPPRPSGMYAIRLSLADTARVCLPTFEADEEDPTVHVPLATSDKLR